MFLLLKNANLFAPAALGINDILICGEKIIAIAPDLVVSWPSFYNFFRVFHTRTLRYVLSCTSCPVLWGV